MKYIKSGYEGQDEKLYIVPIGDLHIGSPHYVHNVLKRELEWIDRHRENTRIIIMGDVAEVATKTSVGAGVYEQFLTPAEQINRAVEILRPFADLIDGVVIGNHELRVYKSDGIDLLKDVFCPKLGIEDKYLGYYGVIKFAWNKRSYDIAVWHGAGGGTTVGGNLNRIEKQRNVVLADIYLMGHVHKRAAFKTDYLVPDPHNMRMKKIEQHFVITGSALAYENSYAEMLGLPPSTKGFPRIILGGRTVNGQRLKEIDVII